ncbi:hypothetical protein [Methanoregula sp.]|jgi:hypothetical protein|uniref:hypothetical protein n=1 Tax=Methanoregula sp. TaxID=2052170 RepID=UPI003C75C437
MCSHETGEFSIEEGLEQDFPGIELVRACYGRSCPNDSRCLLENEFFVMFKFKTDYPSEEAWKSFRNLVATVIACNLDQDTAEDSWVRIEVTMVILSAPFFRIHGHNILPHEVFGWAETDDSTCPVAGSEPA